MNEGKILHALEEINYKIDDIQSMLEMIEPEGMFEDEAVQAFTNVLGRYRVIKTSLERSLKKAGGGATESCLNGKCAADTMW
jgi:hypothetical protein